MCVCVCVFFCVSVAFMDVCAVFAYVQICVSVCPCMY